MIEVPIAQPRKFASTTLTNKYGEAINILGQLFPSGSGRFQDRGLETRIIKRTTAISGQQGRFNGRTMKEVLRAAGNASGAVVAADFGTPQATADDVILWEVDGAQNFVLARYIGHDTASSKPIYAIPSRGIFPVKLTNDGGSQGTSGTAATWTYTVKTLAGDTIKTGVSPERPRPAGAVSNSSTYGTAFYDAGDIKLWDAGEAPGSATCP